jgi:hypothetical protein
MAATINSSLELKVAEERHLVDAGLGRDAPRRRAAKAGLDEHLEGCVEEPIVHLPSLTWV